MKPAEELWAQVQKDLSDPVKGVKSKEYGSAQSQNEQLASTRGIGLNKDDPEPSLLVMTASTTAKKLVTTIDLIHK
jgi:hypothetical protein